MTEYMEPTIESETSVDLLSDDEESMDLSSEGDDCEFKLCTFLAINLPFQFVLK